MIEPLPGDIFRKGQVLNNTYEIEGVLGRGGTGEVYRARNQITGRVVAVKALNRAFSANDAYIELMKREEEMRSITSDAIVRYTDCSRSAEGHVYLVMDYVDGTPLSDWLERGGADARDLMTVARRVAEGLVTAHGRGIVHRDLSPDNIILRGGDPGQAVIIDFGIAKDANAGARTIVGESFAGKYEYAAPEQLHGRAEPRSDLYALGALLLATFRGRVPDPGGSPGAVIERKQRPLDTTGVPEPLRGLIDTLTQPDPARRPPSATAVLGEIDALTRPSAPKPVAAKRGRRWPLAAALLLLLALFAGAGWYLLPFTPPVARPYLLAAERAEDGTVHLSGNAPDKAAGAAIRTAFGEAAGAPAADDALSLASGSPVLDWGGGVAALLATAAPLEEWRLDISDAAASLAGTAPDAASAEAVRASFTEAAAAAGFTPLTRIAIGPLRLMPQAVAAALAPLADCGPLVPDASTPYPMGATVGVTGFVANGATARAVEEALRAVIGGRVARLDAPVLNPTVCGVAKVLPDAPSGGIGIEFGYGDRPDLNPDGIYSTGEQPTISVTLPAEISEGYLMVGLVDVGDLFYSLLPRIEVPDSAVAGLGRVEDGVRRVPIAVSEAEGRADPTAGLIFKVSPPFGQSLLLVVLSDQPLFDAPRPGRGENPVAFAEDFRAALESGRARVLALASRVIETRE